MNKIAEFISKWAFAMFLAIIAIALLFALGCSIYTAITNLAIGLIGISVNLLCLAVIVGWIIIEIKEG